MDKAAQTRFRLHELVARRWSPRAFADRPIEADKLYRLLEAARWAPSSYNAQPWRFIVATKEQPDVYARLLGCLVEFNQEWARQAPVLMITVAERNFSHNGKPNAHAWHDVGLATQNLLVEAMSLDLYGHAMAGFDAEKARAEFGIPPEFEPVAAVALGYLGEAETLPEKLAEQERAPRERKPLEELVFSGTWGEMAPLLET